MIPKGGPSGALKEHKDTLLIESRELERFADGERKGETTTMKHLDAADQNDPSVNQTADHPNTDYNFAKDQLKNAQDRAVSKSSQLS